MLALTSSEACENSPSRQTASSTTPQLMRRFFFQTVSVRTRQPADNFAAVTAVRGRNKLGRGAAGQISRAREMKDRRTLANAKQFCLLAGSDGGFGNFIRRVKLNAVEREERFVQRIVRIEFRF